MHGLEFRASGFRVGLVLYAYVSKQIPSALWSSCGPMLSLWSARAPNLKSTLG